MEYFIPTAAGSALLLLASDPTVAIWGVLITTVGAIVKQIIDRRREREQRERNHQYEMEVLRTQTEATNEYRRLTLAALAENTAMTRSGAHAAAEAKDILSTDEYRLRARRTLTRETSSEEYQ